MPYIGTQPLTGQFKKLDAITVVNGQAAYTLNYNSAAYKPATANALLVSVNGVIQAAGDAFTISGSTITFTENLVTGDVIDFIIALGDTGSAVTPVDGSVTKAKIGTTELDLATIKDSTGTNTALTIDSTGRVLKPSMPFFVLLGGNEGNKTVGNLETFGATNDGQTAFLSSGTIAGIRGFTYTSTTGVITVPVDGLYHIGANIYSNEGTAGQLIALYQNSTIIQYVLQDLTGNATMDIVANLSSGDELSFRNVRGGDSVIYEGKAHTQVYGYLLG